MPKKKIDLKFWIGLLIVIILILVIGYIVLKFTSFPKFGDLDLLDLFSRKADEMCKFDIENQTICVGDNATATINALGDICYVGVNYNNEGWRFAGILMGSNGKFKDSRRMDIIGNYVFAAICGTPINFCRTNDEKLNVIPCDNTDDDGIDYTCGWVGEQCDGTCPTTHPLCVDMWFEGFVGGEYSACACIDPDTETVHPDWKPDGQYHDDDGPEDGDDAPNGDDEETISSYCANLGFNKHWDTHSEGNCIQGAINECGEGAYEYHWNDEKTWCCYKCIEIELDCGQICDNLPVEYGAGKLMSDLYYYPNDCQANSEVNCNYISSLVRWEEYTYGDQDCCCWQCEHWEPGYYD